MYGNQRKLVICRTSHQAKCSQHDNKEFIFIIHNYRNTELLNDELQKIKYYSKTHLTFEKIRDIPATRLPKQECIPPQGIKENKTCSDFSSFDT